MDSPDVCLSRSLHSTICHSPLPSDNHTPYSFDFSCVVELFLFPGNGGQRGGARAGPAAKQAGNARQSASSLGSMPPQTTSGRREQDFALEKAARPEIAEWPAFSLYAMYAHRPLSGSRRRASLASGPLANKPASLQDASRGRARAETCFRRSIPNRCE